MTPQGAQGNKVPGVGLQFCEVDAGATKAKIEEMLKDSSSTQQTNTM